MNLTNSNALVTGADGFIGSHLVESLVRRGVSVTAFVYYNSFNSCGWLDSLDAEIREQINIISGDIRDAYCVKQAMRNCDVVFHLAALIAIPYSYHAPESYIDTNIKGTLNILQAARDLGVNKIVHTSTSEVYGTARFVPIDESHPLQPQSPYSASKIAADQLALSFYHSFELPVSIIRPFNTYGPRQSARAVIPAIISQIANNQECISLGALEPTRDFNFISDTVNGFISVAQTEQSIGEVINIGSNFEISIGDSVKLIAELMGKQVEIKTDTKRLRPKDSEVERLWACNKKAQNLSNWSPHYAGIDGFARGLKETITWFTNPDNLKHYKSNQYNI